MAANVARLRPATQNTAYTVERGVPMPSTISGRFPFADMAPGDSFLVKDETKRRAIDGAIRRYEIRAAANGSPVKFAVRKMDGGYRVFRTI